METELFFCKAQIYAGRRLGRGKLERESERERERERE